MIRSLLVLNLCAFAALAAAPELSDIAFSKEIHYRIQEGAAGYRLAAETTIRRTALTERAARTTTFKVVEQGYSTVSGLRGESRGRSLGKDAITFHFPRIEDTFIPPARIHELDFPNDLKIGDTVTYSWREDFKDLAFIPVARVPALDRVERFELWVEHPADLRVEFSTFFPHGELKTQVDRSLPTRTVLRFQDIPRPRTVPNDPYGDIQAAVLPRFNKGSISLTPTVPEAFAKWYAALAGPMPEPSAGMKSLLAEELGKAATAREKTRILFDFVKTSIRYLADEGAMHAFIPHPPAEVLEKRYGDCKDKAWLLAALGRIHGLPIHPVLLSTDTEPEFPELNPTLFNHVICALEDGPDLIYMDPTATYSEMGSLPDSDLLARALVLDPAKPRSTVIPSAREGAEVEILVEGDLSKPREAKAKITLRHGWRTSAIRSRKELKALDLENTLSNRLNRMLAKVSVDHLHFVEEDRERVLLEADVDLTEFFVRTDLRVYAPTAPFRAIQPELLERAKDADPVDAQGPDRFRLELRLKSEGLTPRPEQVSLGQAGAACHTAACAAEGGKIRLIYDFEQPYRQVPAGAREAFLQFCAQYLQSNRKLFIFQRSTL
jgi:hypothetical protein